MTSFADTLMTPQIDAKIRTSLFKYKTSNFKDILRERFRNQIRANRRALFEKMRTLDDSKEVQNTLGDYLRNQIQEFDIVEQKKRAKHHLSSQCSSEESDIDHDTLLEVMKEIESELLDEQYKWILEEYSREEEQIISFYEMEPIICPLCQRGVLQKHDLANPISCTNCELRLYYSSTLDNFHKSLKQSVEEHSRSCGSIPQFGILNEGVANTLFMTCDHCSFLYSLN